MAASANKSSAEALALRITVVDPPPDISWALQLGREELVKPTLNTGARISFDLSVEVLAGDSASPIRFRGPAVQGRPGERFVYLCVGSYAGQVGTPASGRAKVSLESITWKLLQKNEGQALRCVRSAVRRHRARRRAIPGIGDTIGRGLAGRVKQSSPESARSVYCRR